MKQAIIIAMAIFLAGCTDSDAKLCKKAGGEYVFHYYSIIYIPVGNSQMPLMQPVYKCSFVK